jgi:hypothetical protein
VFRATGFDRPRSLGVSERSLRFVSHAPAAQHCGGRPGRSHHAPSIEHVRRQPHSEALKHEPRHRDVGNVEVTDSPAVGRLVGSKLWGSEPQSHARAHGSGAAIRWQLRGPMGRPPKRSPRHRTRRSSRRFALSGHPACGVTRPRASSRSAALRLCGMVDASRLSVRICARSRVVACVQPACGKFRRMPPVQSSLRRWLFGAQATSHGLLSPRGFDPHRARVRARAKWLNAYGGACEGDHLSR